MADPRARLYLVSPVLEGLADLPPGLGEVLAAGDVACLLLRLKPMPERAAKELVRHVAAIVQPQGVALLVEEPRVAARTGADGVHVSDPGEVFAAALDSLKPERIVGIGGDLSRDDAMRVGEAGADYIMFGDDDADAAQTLDEVGWWAEIFNVPCIGHAGALEQVEALAATGAEFVSLGTAVWRDPRGPTVAVAEAEATLSRVAAQVAGASV